MALGTPPLQEDNASSVSEQALFLRRGSKPGSWGVGIGAWPNRPALRIEKPWARGAHGLRCFDGSFFVLRQAKEELIPYGPPGHVPQHVAPGASCCSCHGLHNSAVSPGGCNAVRLGQEISRLPGPQGAAGGSEDTDGFLEN